MAWVDSVSVSIKVPSRSKMTPRMSGRGGKGTGAFEDSPQALTIALELFAMQCGFEAPRGWGDDAAGVAALQRKHPSPSLDDRQKFRTIESAKKS